MHLCFLKKSILSNLVSRIDQENCKSVCIICYEVIISVEGLCTVIPINIFETVITFRGQSIKKPICSMVGLYQPTVERTIQYCNT